MTATLRLARATAPLDAVVAVPGSKSIANRALVCAALATGASELTNVPGGDDTVAMVGALAALGVHVDTAGDRAVITGTGGRLATGAARIDAGLAGTTSRFVTALAAMAAGPVTIDGAPPLRRRPMGPLHDALAALGAGVETPAGAGRLPVVVTGPLRAGGRLPIAGDVSSQYLTALMLVAPLLAGGLRLDLATPLVSRPYLELTADVMASFGVTGVEIGDRHVVVPPGRYRPCDLGIEPDASSAGYALAMAAVAGGRVRVPGLSRSSRQADVVVAALLERMGARLGPDSGALEVTRAPGSRLRGLGDVDLAAASDLVPTIAVVATTAATATTIRGVGFVRAKESDRLGDLAGELVKTGAAVTVTPDGLHIEPVPDLHGAVLDTHHDHRLAMAFGVLGTTVEGIVVRDPSVVAKSWPDFWTVRDAVVDAVAGRP